ELVIGAARGEPMDVEELERLRAERSASLAVDADLRAQEDLTRQLAALRDAIRAPQNDEERLLESFRAAHARRTRSRRQLRLGAGAAGVAAAAAAIVVVAALRHVEEAAPVPTPAAASSGLVRDGGPEGQAGAAAVFHPLPFSPGVSPGASYSVVRVRIPVSSFPALYADEPYASVDADIL